MADKRTLRSLIPISVFIFYYTVITVSANALILVPIYDNGKEYDDNRYIAISRTELEGARHLTLDPGEPIKQQELPPPYVNENSFVNKRFAPPGRRQDPEGTRPGTPLRFGKRSLARYVLGRIVEKGRRTKANSAMVA